MSRQRILVCGSRDWSNEKVIRDRLNESLSAIVIHGGADGADKMAAKAAYALSMHSAEMRPLWGQFGKQAGYLRNCAMLDLEPDLVIAFSTGSRGTQMTIDEARKRGIPVEIHGTELVIRDKGEHR